MSRNVYYADCIEMCTIGVCIAQISCTFILVGLCAGIMQDADFLTSLMIAGAFSVPLTIIWCMLMSFTLAVVFSLTGMERYASQIDSPTFRAFMSTFWRWESAFSGETDNPFAPLSSSSRL